jgi:hypothetical protein
VKRSNSKMLAVALRRGWIVLVTIAAVTGIVLAVDEARTGEATAEAVAVVPAGAGDASPGNATQATQLAQTYVEAIPLDTAVREHVAEQVERPLEEVDDAIAVLGNPDTSVLRLRYRDSSRERALAAAAALLEAVVGNPPVAQGVAAGSLVALSDPAVVRETGGGERSTAIPVGIILGLLLGLVLLVAWERSDPRIDGPQELAAAAGTPTTALDDVAPGNIGALLERWRRLAGYGSGPHVIGLLAATSSAERLVGPAAAALARLSEGDGRPLRVSATPPPPDSGEPGLVLVTGGRPGGPSAGEALAHGAAVVVLTVERGARATELQRAIDVLEQFGGRPAWALLVRRGGAAERA